MNYKRVQVLSFKKLLPGYPSNGSIVHLKAHITPFYLSRYRNQRHSYRTDLQIIYHVLEVRSGGSLQKIVYQFFYKQE